GWNICFNEVVVCLTSYHVLCGRYWNITHSNMKNPTNNPLGGDTVLLNGDNNARVHAYPEVVFDGRLNSYELAMAQYKAPTDAEIIMRSCQAGYPVDKYDYPRRL